MLKNGWTYWPFFNIMHETVKSLRIQQGRGQNKLADNSDIFLKQELTHKLTSESG